MFVLVMIYVYMIEMMIIMQVLLCLVILEVMDDEFEYDQVSLNHEGLNIG